MARHNFILSNVIFEKKKSLLGTCLLVHFIWQINQRLKNRVSYLGRIKASHAYRKFFETPPVYIIWLDLKSQHLRFGECVCLERRNYEFRSRPYGNWTVKWIVQHWQNPFSKHPYFLRHPSQQINATVVSSFLTGWSTFIVLFTDQEEPKKCRHPSRNRKFLK